MLCAHCVLMYVCMRCLLDRRHLKCVSMVTSQLELQSSGRWQRSLQAFQNTRTLAHILCNAFHCQQTACRRLDALVEAAKPSVVCFFHLGLQRKIGRMHVFKSQRRGVWIHLFNPDRNMISQKGDWALKYRSLTWDFLSKIHHILIACASHINTCTYEQHIHLAARANVSLPPPSQKSSIIRDQGVAVFVPAQTP